MMLATLDGKRTKLKKYGMTNLFKICKTHQNKTTIGNLLDLASLPRLIAKNCQSDEAIENF